MALNPDGSMIDMGVPAAAWQVMEAEALIAAFVLVLVAWYHNILPIRRLMTMGYGRKRILHKGLHEKSHDWEEWHYKFWGADLILEKHYLTQHNAQNQQYLCQSWTLLSPHLQRLSNTDVPTISYP
jgi:hypothetical protein